MYVYDLPSVVELLSPPTNILLSCLNGYEEGEMSFEPYEFNDSVS